LIRVCALPSGGLPGGTGRTELQVKANTYQILRLRAFQLKQKSDSTKKPEDSRAFTEAKNKALQAQDRWAQEYNRIHSRLPIMQTPDEMLNFSTPAQYTVPAGMKKVTTKTATGPARPARPAKPGTSTGGATPSATTTRSGATYAAHTPPVATKQPRKQAQPQQRTPAAAGSAGTGTAARVGSRRGAAPDEEAPKKRRRYRPGTLALREIRKYQKTTNLLIGKRRFYLLIREICQNLGAPLMCWQGAALQCIHEAAEFYMTRLFEDATLCTVHGGRQTLFLKDLVLAKRIRGGQADTDIYPVEYTDVKELRALISKKLPI
jgi:histone H3/H4